MNSLVLDIVVPTTETGTLDATGGITIVEALQVGPPGPAGSSGVAMADAPLHYDPDTRGLSIDVGTTAGTVAAGDDSRLSDARTPTTHSHPESQVTNLVSDLAGKAATVHTHAESDVTSLAADLASKETPAGAQAKVDALQALIYGGTPPALLDTLTELATQMQSDESGVAALTSTVATKAADSAVVHLSGTETVTGDKNFTGALTKSGVAVETTTGAQTKADAARSFGLVAALIFGD